MTKTTLNVEGMMCGMCEACMNEAIRKAFEVKKVSSSHSKNLTEIISEADNRASVPVVSWLWALAAKYLWLLGAGILMLIASRVIRIWMSQMSYGR